MVRTIDLPSKEVFDEIIGNRDGSTVRVPAIEVAARMRDAFPVYVDPGALALSTEISRGEGRYWDTPYGRCVEAGPLSSDYDIVNAVGVKLRVLATPGVGVNIQAFRSSTDTLDGDGWPVDWSPILQRAYDRALASGKVPIAFPPCPVGKEYVCKSALDISAGHWIALAGELTQRGRNSNSTSGWARTTIKFDPEEGALSDEWFIDDYAFFSPNHAGPYTFENITFDFSLANGIRLGRRDTDLDGTDEDLDTEDPEQRYVSGAVYRNCAFIGPIVDVTHDASGEIMLSDHVLLAFAKAFELTISDCSFYRGGTQIDMYGCDRPVLQNVRGGNCQVGIRMTGSGSYAVNAVVLNFQIEIYALAAIIVDGVSAAITNPRIEQRENSEFNGSFNLSETASVTAGSNTITMSADVSDKLFGRTSVIRVTHSSTGESFFAAVSSVAGDEVTLLGSEYFEVPFTDAAASVTRFLPGILHITGGGDAGCSITGGSMNPAYDNPPIVWVANRGSMSVMGITRTKGSETTSRGALIVGNKMGTNPNVNGRLTMMGCDPNIMADVRNPFVVCDAHDTRGTGSVMFSNTLRLAFGSGADESRRTTRRALIFTPRNSAATSNGSSQVRLREMEIDPVTGEKSWGWVKTADDDLLLVDEKLPSNGTVRIRILARALSETGSGTGFLKCYFADDGGSSPIISETIGETAAIYEAVVSVPSSWQTTGSAPRSIWFEDAGGSDVFIVAVEIEQLFTDDQSWSGEIEYMGSAFRARFVGSGSPEGVQSCGTGSTWHNKTAETDGTGVELYVKTTASGNTGWAPVATV